MTKTVLPVILLAASVGNLSRNAFSQTQSAASELEKLAAFLGNTEGEIRDTQYSKARIRSNDEMTCDWTPNHGFLLCDQTIYGPAGTKNDLTIDTYNEPAYIFSFFGLSRNDTEARTTKVTIEGNPRTYFDESDEGGKHILRTTNKFTSPTKVMWRSEYSQDGGGWILIGEGADTRVRTQSPSTTESTPTAVSPAAGGPIADGGVIHPEHAVVINAAARH